MNKRGGNSTVALGLCALAFSLGSWALDDQDGTANNCTNFNPYGNAYFGDLHVHTTFSVDAFTQGVDTTPEQAYLFAMGEEIGLHPFDINGEPTRFVQLERPLDFAMVADHAEFFGEYNICNDPGNPLYSDPTCVELRERDDAAFFNWNALLGRTQDSVTRFPLCGPDGSICTDASATTWQRMVDAAEQFYDRSSECTFTTFVGYEWTGAPSGQNEEGVIEIRNLHRNVVFLNSIVPETPSTYLDTPYPEDLWTALQNDCLDMDAGSNQCRVLTIPHNSNLSQGLMFETVNPNGQPYGLGTALKRAKFEPLVEVMQHKGQSECLPSASDELCDFEVVPWGHLAGNFLTPTVPKPEGTVRDALKQGLALKPQLGGVNVFQYGFVGSTDTHLGTPGLVAETADYPGHGGAAEGTGGVPLGDGLTDTPEFNPGGLAVVWAQQNSRRALFDAMRRKEVYATSGPRHIVRFWGGWDLDVDICSRPDRTEYAYNNAVPMGSTLGIPATRPSEPQFMVSALKDPGTPGNSGNELQRIQIVKGWTDAWGQKHEAVFEVAGNPDNGAGVDTGTCTTTGTGYAELCQLWEDPQFDPDQEAFYYARVVENPSCRWTQRQCLAADPPIDCLDPNSVPESYAPCCDEDIPKTVQERSWTSPIWFNPVLYEPVPGC